jgi:putative ubiquitin-RnfH superfamily antitoxin RatB of RatAB toxin-antitoxin module
MAELDQLEVEVVYAHADRQIAIRLRVPQGTTVATVIECSGVAREVPDGDLTRAPVGIFGRVVSPDTQVRDGDRVEIYRPLVADPKQARRERAGGGGARLRLGPRRPTEPKETDGFPP